MFTIGVRHVCDSELGYGCWAKSRRGAGGDEEDEEEVIESLRALNQRRQFTQ